MADRLADLGPIHLFGYPGFGSLPADPSIHSLDDLFGWFVEQLPPEASHVIAQSMGGVLAVHLALEHPERVASVVLVATSGGVDVARLLVLVADVEPSNTTRLATALRTIDFDGVSTRVELPRGFVRIWDVAQRRKRAAA